MTDNIMEEFQRNKFVITDSNILDIADTNLVILSDVGYWVDNFESLQVWCKEYDCELRGMTVTCSDVALTAFVLRWS